MAKEKLKTYVVTVTNNPNFCGTGAGGVQFAYGKATINNPRLVKWFQTHKGYEVKEVKEAAEG